MMKITLFIRTLIALSVAAFVLTGCISAKPKVMEEPVAAMAADSDGDGVLDDKDECPGTPAGAPVDDKGCEILLRLSGVNFAFDSSAISEQGQALLSDVAAEMKAGTSKMFEIAGHTDNVGSDEYNELLGQRRASSVVNFLASQGIPIPAMMAKSYGETKPIADNNTSEGRAQNRRVEIVDLGSN